MATKELSGLIEKLIEEKTFSLDGVKSIDALKVKATSLEESLERSKSEVITIREANVKLQDEIKKEREEKNELKSREDAIEKREKAVTAIELRAAVSDARSQALGEVFNTIFRNAEVRETVTKTVPVVKSYNTNGMQDYVSSETSTETRTTERS